MTLNNTGYCFASIDVDLEQTVEQEIWTVPNGRRFIPVRILLRDLSAIPDKEIRLYFDSTSDADIKVLPATIENAFDSIGGFTTGFVFDIFSTNSLSANYLDPRRCGNAGETLIFKMNTANASPCTAVIDVVGFLIDG